MWSGSAGHHTRLRTKGDGPFATVVARLWNPPRLFKKFDILAFLL